MDAPFAQNKTAHADEACGVEVRVFAYTRMTCANVAPEEFWIWTSCQSLAIVSLSRPIPELEGGGRRRARNGDGLIQR